MRAHMRSVLCVMASVFVALGVLSLVVAPGQASASVDGSVLQDDTPTATETPACVVERDQATWGQYTQELTITPDEQHDEAGSQWVTTWSASGQPGLTAQGLVFAYHCYGDISGLTYCAPDRSAYTTTHSISFTLSPSGTTSFSVREQVSCCEFAQVDLVEVNGSRWGSSYFDRKAWGPICLSRTGTPTATGTPTGTASATATQTETATTTATTTSAATVAATSTTVATTTPTATAIDTVTSTPTATETSQATPTETATEATTTTPTATDMPGATATATPTALSTPTATETQTATPTASETPVATATATATETATTMPTGTATATATETMTPTETATVTTTATVTATLRRGLIWYFPLIHKDDLPVF